MNKEVFENLALLEQNKKRLEAEIEVARTAVAEEMQKHEADKVESEYGSFFFTTRKKWKYSPMVEALEKGLKEQKKIEEETKVAIAEETKSLSFRAAKGE